MVTGRECAERFGSGLRELVLRGGDGSRLERWYAPEVRFAAYLPGEVVDLRGRRRAVRALERWHPAPAEMSHWTVREFDGGTGDVVGVRVDVEWRDVHGRSRRTHHLQVGRHGVDRHLVLSDRPSMDGLPVGEAGPALAALYERSTERSMIGSGTSGTPLERVVCGGDSYVVKWLAPGGDWQSRVTGDPGREARLWSQGWLDRLPAGVGHPILAAEPFGDGMWVTISRDLSPYLLRGRRLSLPAMRGYLAALCDMYDTFTGGELPTGLVSTEQRWGMLWPAAVESEHRHPDAFLKAVARGWDLLDSAVDPEIAEAVRLVVSDPGRLTSSLVPTLLHGDAHPANAALEGSTLVLFDWSLATAGAPEVEGAWLANFAQFYEFGIDELLALWRSVRGHRHDEEALGLSLLGQAAGLVPALLSSVVDDSDPLHRWFSRGKLDWWRAVVRRFGPLLRSPGC